MTALCTVSAYAVDHLTPVPTANVDIDPLSSLTRPGESCLSPPLLPLFARAVYVYPVPPLCATHARHPHLPAASQYPDKRRPTAVLSACACSQPCHASTAQLPQWPTPTLSSRIPRWDTWWGTQRGNISTLALAAQPPSPAMPTLPSNRARSLPRRPQRRPLRTIATLQTMAFMRGDKSASQGAVEDGDGPHSPALLTRQCRLDRVLAHYEHLRPSATATARRARARGRLVGMCWRRCWRSAGGGSASSPSVSIEGDSGERAPEGEDAQEGCYGDGVEVEEEEGGAMDEKEGGHVGRSPAPTRRGRQKFVARSRGANHLRIPRKKHLDDKHEKDLALSYWDEETVDSQGLWDQKLISTKQMVKKLVIVRIRILRARAATKTFDEVEKNEMSADCSTD
ncbi:hypothetical protein B0H14DRAFT_2609289 [Mycena olivaceomarginata]|nr:hypothetical protein B0H14DRAFT_2609289 [Mycena olivaceomarginata]